MVKETEFYELLNVSVEADENEIKRSYRRLALRYHPDKNTGDENAADMFKSVSNAYEVLSDPDRRRIYDQYGKEGLEGGMNEGGGFHDAADIFSMFFGGGARGRREEPKPKDIVHQLRVTLDDLYNGKKQKVAISRTRFCATCEGSGLRPGGVRVSCTVCNGHGAVLRSQQVFPGFYQQVQVPCSACGGKGEVVKASDVCTSCNGARTVREKKMMTVDIDRGTLKTDHFSFVGEGNQEPGIRLSGDVLIFLEVSKHPVFVRVGDHLVMTAHLTLQEALCGFAFPIEHLDGRQIVIKPSPGDVISSSFVWQVYNEGMPVKNTGGLQRGNLFIRFTIDWPDADSLSMDQINTIAKAFGVPEKSPLVGGQKLELTDYTPKKTRNSSNPQQKGSGKRGGRQPRGHGNRGQAGVRQPNSNEEENDEYEDVTDEDEEGVEHVHPFPGAGGFFASGGPQGFATAQPVECAPQ